MATHSLGIVYGPPGCGKTHFIGEQILKMQDNGVKPAQIAIVSFTRAAAEVIKGRGMRVPRGNIGTLHSFCYSLAGNPEIAEEKPDEFNAAYPGFRISAGKESPLTDDMGFSEFEGSGQGEQLLSQYNNLRAKLIPREQWPYDVKQFAQFWENFKRETGRMDYTDLIEFALVNDLFPEFEPKIMFVDEAQDLDLMQLKLLQQWLKRLEILFLVGDDDQSLYYFRGASAEGFMQVAEGAAFSYLLDQSYRVPELVLNASQRLIKLVEHRIEKEYRPRKDKKTGETIRGSVRYLPELTLNRPAQLVKLVEQDLARGENAMILALCGYMLKPVTAALKEAGLPFANWYRPSRPDWNPLTPAKGVSASQRLLNFLRPCETVYGSHSRGWTYKEVATWAEGLEASKVFRPKQKKQLETLSGDEPADLDRLLEIFTDEALTEAVTMGVREPEALNWFKSNLMASKQAQYEFVLKVAQKHGAKVLARQAPVCVGTYHSVKGGQAQNVYCAPDMSSAAAVEYAQGGEARDAIIRAGYVGFTRSQDNLTLLGRGAQYALPFGKVA